MDLTNNVNWENKATSEVTSVTVLAPEGHKNQILIDDEETLVSLTEITPEEAFNKRKLLNSGLLIKKDSHIYFTEYKSIPKSNFGLGQHLCFSCTKARAKPEAEGGCSKICDFFPTSYLYDRRWKKYHCRLEKYAFIDSGIESINLKEERLIVCNCSQFIFEPTQKQRSQEELNQLRLKLLQKIGVNITITKK